jgi:hypothetical protein
LGGLHQRNQTDFHLYKLDIAGKRSCSSPKRPYRDVRQAEAAHSPGIGRKVLKGYEVVGSCMRKLDGVYTFPPHCGRAEVCCLFTFPVRSRLSRQATDYASMDCPYQIMLENCGESPRSFERLLASRRDSRQPSFKLDKTCLRFALVLA